jgi:hypothetical protein
MSPALFAMVDAVLWAEWRWAVRNGVHPVAYRTLRGRVGWWRSCWPVGGEA